MGLVPHEGEYIMTELTFLCRAAQKTIAIEI